MKLFEVPVEVVSMKIFSEKLKLTFFINMYGLVKIPLVLFIGPRVVESTAQKFILKVPLSRRVKNHLNSMYFGALAIGAELSIAAAAVVAITESKQKIDFVFKDFKADFLKRGEGDVFFVFEDVETVVQLIQDSLSSEERLEKKMKGYAYVPAKSSEPIMTYELTLSVKNRSKKS